MSEREAIRSLWIGPRLSALEQLCAASFVRVGHPFELFVYDTPEGVPPGVTLRDAGEIVPRDQVFAYERGDGRGSYAAVSNLFRYRLLLERGGWWVDLDVVALRPFDFADEHVFGWETDEWIASSVMRAPAGSALMQRCHDVAAQRGADINWGDVGPRLLTPMIRELGWAHRAQPRDVFYPWHASEWSRAVEPGARVPGPPTVGVHLWNEMFRRHGVDKDGTFPASSMIEQLKRRVLAPL